MINCSVLIIKTKQPFVDWLRSLPKPANITIDEVNSDNTAYLIEDCESDDEGESILTHCYDMIFEDQLAGWWMDESDWPKARGLEILREWFEVEIHSMVVDLLDEPLLHDE